MFYVRNVGLYGRFYGLYEKIGNSGIGKQSITVSRLVNDDENECRSIDQREEHRILSQPTCYMVNSF